MKADLDKMNQTVTLAEVAEAAGVSVMTVSRALRNAHDCSIKTRERIQALATKMGYTPNPLVSAFQANIRNRRNREYVATIGWLSDFPVRGFWKNSPDFLSSLWKGALSQAEALGFRLDEIWIGDALETPDLKAYVASCRRQMVARGIVGVIIPSGRNTSLFLSDWPEMAVICDGFHYAAMIIKEQPTLYHTVMSNYYHNMIRICLELEKKGCQRIGFYLPVYLDYKTQGIYRGAYLSWQFRLSKKNQLPIFIADIPLGTQEPRDFFDWVKKNKPDAVICSKSETLGWLEKMGMVVPRDIFVAHLWLAEDVADWSGIDPLQETIGAKMVDMLVGQLYRNERKQPDTPIITEVTGRWIEGKTT